MSSTIRVKAGRGRPFLCVVGDPGHCKICGAAIVWAETARGERIPLEPWFPGTDKTESHFAHCSYRQWDSPPSPSPPRVAPVRGVPMTLRVWRNLILLVHPDKHPGGEELSNEMTRWLLDQKPRLIDKP